jgi:hypothetical protein
MNAAIVGQARLALGNLSPVRSSNCTTPPPHGGDMRRTASVAGRPGARWLHPSHPHRPESGNADPTNHPIISTTSRLEDGGLPRISFLVPATWRIRDGRKLPCPAILAGQAVVLGHSNLRAPCPMPQLRTPLLWVDDRIEEQPPATAVATTINGLPVRLLRVHPATRGQAASDELMYWREYPRGRGFQIWVVGREVRAELLDPAGGAVLDQVLATLHRS